MRETPSVKNLSSDVVEVRKEVTPEDVDSWIRLQGAEDRRYKLRTVVEAWDSQQTEDRKMRRRYAKVFMWIIGLQILAINTAFFLIGFGIITIGKMTLEVFFVSVFAEIVSMTLVILKYLFPKLGTELLKLLENM